MTSGPALPPPGWHADPDPAAPPGRLRYWDGRTWTDHLAWARQQWPPPPPPPPPSQSTVSPSPSMPMPGYSVAIPRGRAVPRPDRTTHWIARAVGIVVLAVVVIAAVGIGVAATDTRTSAPPTTTTTFAPGSSATARNLESLMVPPPAGYRVVQDSPAVPPSIAAAVGPGGDALARQLARDGYVNGWQRTFASTTSDAHITVTVLQMASTAGVSDYVPASVRPYLLRRGWSFDHVADGFGAVGLSTRLPLDRGEYGSVFVLPVGQSVLQIETRASDPTGPQDLVAGLANLESSLIDG